MRLYIATPVTSRNERTLEEKCEAAKRRIEQLMELLTDDQFFKNYELFHTFDLNATCEISEAEAMGRCIQLVLSCDAIYLDEDWEKSKGCRLEFQAATIYDKNIFKHNDFF